MLAGSNRQEAGCAVLKNPAPFPSQGAQLSRRFFAATVWRFGGGRCSFGLSEYLIQNNQRWLSNMHAREENFNKIKLFQYDNRHIKQPMKFRLFTNLLKKSKIYYKNVI
jgi:hypothetical protein